MDRCNDMLKGVPAIARFLDVSPDQVRAWIKGDAAFPAYRDGAAAAGKTAPWRANTSELLAWHARYRARMLGGLKRHPANKRRPRAPGNEA